MFKTVPIFAAVAKSGLLSGLSVVLGLVMAIGFIYGAIKIIGGAANYNRDPDGAKQSIIAGVLIAAAVTLMFVLFKAFGLTPDLDVNFDGI